MYDPRHLCTPGTHSRTFIWIVSWCIMLMTSRYTYIADLVVLRLGQSRVLPLHVHVKVVDTSQLGNPRLACGVVEPAAAGVRQVLLLILRWTLLPLALFRVIIFTCLESSIYSHSSSRQTISLCKGTIKFAYPRALQRKSLPDYHLSPPAHQDW